jgi:hypothetical protein
MSTYVQEEEFVLVQSEKTTSHANKMKVEAEKLEQEALVFELNETVTALKKWKEEQSSNGQTNENFSPQV